jgi:hypothetical protein
VANPDEAAIVRLVITHDAELGSVATGSFATAGGGAVTFAAGVYSALSSRLPQIRSIFDTIPDTLIEERDCPRRIYWRRERNCRRTLSA